MSDDDLIRRALGAEREADTVSDALIHGAIARGARRRRRRVWLASGVCGCLLAGAGLALVAANRQPDAVVGGTLAPVVTPTPAPETSSPRSTPPPTPAPETAPIASAVPSTASTAPVTTDAGSPSTTEVATPPATDLISKCPAGAQIELDDVQFTVEGPAPLFGQSVLTQREVDHDRTTIEVWSESGRAATLDESVADQQELFWCATRLQPLGYDGRWIWVWTGSSAACAECVVPRSQLIRADLATGELALAWASDIGSSILDLVPDGAGGATIVTGPAGDDPHIRVVTLSPDGSTRSESAWAVEAAPIVSAGVQRSSGRVAYTVGNPGPVWSPPELHILRPESDENRLIPMDGWSVRPEVISWEPIGERLLVRDSWENPRMTVVDLRLAHPESELTDIGDAACWSATGMLAAGRWDSGYVENDWSSGTIELVDLEGRPVADFGIDVLAGEMACLTDGRIAFTRYVKDFDTIVPDSVTLTIAKPDGSMHDITQDPLWVLGADAAL